MNSPQSKSQKFNGSPMMSRVILHDELITEVLSFLPVKSLLQFKSVCKSWKTLISHPSFIKLHLKRSQKNKHLTLFSRPQRYSRNFSALTFPVRSLLDKTSTTFNNKYYSRLNDDVRYLDLIGSCNGLLLLRQLLKTSNSNVEFTFYLWNPATRTLSNKIEFLTDICNGWRFAFGYDNSTDTYKIVAFNKQTNDTRVFKLGDNIWRKIQSCHVLPFGRDQDFYTLPYVMGGVYVSGTVNWLVVSNETKFSTIDKLVITSFDFSKETDCQLLPPRGFDFDKVLSAGPILTVLMDSLCFSHDFNGTDFIIWHMKEFGVQESWIQFIKISYRSLLIDYNVLSYVRQLILFPLCLSENGDTLILAWYEHNQAIIYNLKNNIVEKTKITNKINWYLVKDYVESLVQPILKNIPEEIVDSDES